MQYGRSLSVLHALCAVCLVRRITEPSPPQSIADGWTTLSAIENNTVRPSKAF